MPVASPDVIRTARLRLVPVLERHAVAMYPVLADASLHEYTGGEPPASVQAVETWFRTLETRQSPDGSQQWLTWVLDCEGELAGYVQATVTDDAADIAWLVGAAWQGNGYASEAASALVNWLREQGTHTIRAHVHPQHSASQSVAKAAGLAPSGQMAGVEETWVLVR